MAKEIKCETYRQRCEFLGKDAQVFDMLLSNNGIFVPAPIVKTILVEWEQYKKDGDLHLSVMARIRKESYDAYHEVLGDVRSAIVPDEYDMQVMREALNKWIERGKEWDNKERYYRKTIKKLKRILGR